LQVNLVECICQFNASVKAKIKMPIQ